MMNDNMLMTFEEIGYVIANNFRFQYPSYDYKSAIEEFKTTNEYIKNVQYYTYGGKIDGSLIPKDIKEKHKIFQVGRIFSIIFRQNTMNRINIGRRVQKSFSIENIGGIVKPLVDPYNDKYNLIERGLAISKYDVTLLNK